MDWKKARSAIEGPICWNCFLGGVFFCCSTCNKYFHRECSFMKNGYPHPIFDKSINEACRAKFGEVHLIKCPICLVAEQTSVFTPQLRNVSNDDLNKALYLALTKIETEIASDLLAIGNYVDDPEAISVAIIKERANTSMYKTLEGFFADFRMILYAIISKDSRTESPAAMIGKRVLNCVTAELGVIISCVECSVRRFKTAGKLLNVNEYMRVNPIPCKVPHVVVWIKDGTHPFWPAKVLDRRDHNEKEKSIYIQYFGERAQVRSIQYMSADFKFIFKTYSKTCPGKQPSRNEKQGNTWRMSLTNCEKYLNNMRERFGNDGVFIPEDANEFDFDLDNALKTMYPLYENQREESSEI